MGRIGVICGSGLDNPEIVKEAEEMVVETPYGSPSSAIICGAIGRVPVAILSRHGRKHSIHPSAVNYRANVWALKSVGCMHVLATTACGSLKEAIKPGHIVLLDQFIDRTSKRTATFYDEGQVCHIPMSEPFCPRLRQDLEEAARRLAVEYHRSGTTVTIEGPRFSSKAESRLFRSWGCDVVNMTTVPEVALAREAGVCYAAVAICTDYDSWHDTEAPVSTQMVLHILEQSAETVIRLLVEALPHIELTRCACQECIETSVIHPK